MSAVYQCRNKGEHREEKTSEWKLNSFSKMLYRKQKYCRFHSPDEEDGLNDLELKSWGAAELGGPGGPHLTVPTSPEPCPREPGPQASQSGGSGPQNEDLSITCTL